MPGRDLVGEWGNWGVRRRWLAKGVNAIVSKGGFGGLVGLKGSRREGREIEGVGSGAVGDGAAPFPTPPPWPGCPTGGRPQGRGRPPSRTCGTQTRALAPPPPKRGDNGLQMQRRSLTYPRGEAPGQKKYHPNTNPCGRWLVCRGPLEPSLWRMFPKNRTAPHGLIPPRGGGGSSHL